MAVPNEIPCGRGQSLMTRNCFLDHDKSPLVSSFSASRGQRDGKSSSPTEAFSTCFTFSLENKLVILPQLGVQCMKKWNIRSYQRHFSKGTPLWPLAYTKPKSFHSPSQCWKPEHRLICQNLDLLFPHLSVCHLKKKGGGRGEWCKYTKNRHQ